jgi:tetratricopeptide (TPR) repeat protein
MELLYNPDAMSEQEIKATFVARQPLVDKLISLIERQPDGAGVQHIVIIAPRGMGKTTVLLMVKFAIKDRGLADRWQAVKFPEESYGIYDLADFWIQVLELLAVETGDDAPRVQAEKLKRKYPNNDDLQEAALAALKDWRCKHKKRLLLLVDNFDMILEQINDEHDNARLRDVLMNDGTMMLIGGATTFFKEARAYDQPLYNFFQIENLADLKFEQMQQLLRSRAQQDAIPNFDATLKTNVGRLRVLEYFTGGNPRLVLMMYRVVTQSDLSEVRRGLEKLLDEVTPYYKARIEALPPQQRKILDHIARISGKTSEGLTPAEIAEAVRLSPNQVSAQLKRLSEIGYVRAANLRGRSVPYTLSEPFYAIWHQMRFGRDARQRMQWLVSFLKSWYAREEMEPESNRLEMRFREHLTSGRMREARDTLEHHRYLAEAMDDIPLRARALEKIIHGHLEIGEDEIIRKELLAGVRLENLSEETLNRLFQKGCITEKQLRQAEKTGASIEPSKPDQKVAELQGESILALLTGNLEKALDNLDQSLAIKPDMHEAWNNRGFALNALGRREEAIASYDKALAIKPDMHEAWYNRGFALNALGRREEAIASYDKALAIKPDKHEAWNNRGNALNALGRREEAIASYDKALAIKPDKHEAWYNRGFALNALGRREEAIASYDKALAIKPDKHEAWNGRGISFEAIGDYDEAIRSLDQALAINPALPEAQYNRSYVYLKKVTRLMKEDEFEQAKKSWKQMVESAGIQNREDWIESILADLLSIAQTGHLKFARELITESGLEERLFPLVRAIDYLQTDDESLVEQLSPEVRGIVKEVVDKLRPVAKNTTSANRKKK